MNIILGNMGNESIALIEWAYKARLADVYVISIDTGWMASQWPKRIAAGRELSLKYGFEWVSLASKPGFEQLVKDRGSFPSTKFHWCAGFLKGLPLLAWLDQHDPQGEACILLGLYRQLSRAHANLPEFIQESEHFGDRKVWYPLYDRTKIEVNNFTSASGLPLLEHRSLECEPCVNSCRTDFQRMSEADIAKTKTLETSIAQSMFAEVKPGDNAIEDVVQYAREQLEPNAQHDLAQFDGGCGPNYGCGT